jgi:LysM repeat protein
MGTYARRSPLRFLAPVALIAFGLALLVIVSSSNSGDSGNTPSASEREKDRDLGTTSSKKSKRKSRASANGTLPSRSYTVKSGDTLQSISEKTGIPVEKLQELNPQLDPQQLVSGQKIKLRE